MSAGVLRIIPSPGHIPYPSCEELRASDCAVLFGFTVASCKYDTISHTLFNCSSSMLKFFISHSQFRGQPIHGRPTVWWRMEPHRCRMLCNIHPDRKNLWRGAGNHTNSREDDNSDGVYCQTLDANLVSLHNDQQLFKTLCMTWQVNHDGFITVWIGTRKCYVSKWMDGWFMNDLCVFCFSGKLWMDW